MKLIGNTSTFEIIVLNKSNPKSYDESDRKWIQIELKIKLEGFTSHQNIELYDEDLLDFKSSIETFLSDMSKPIVFNTLEESIFLKGEIDERGQILWEGYTIYPIGNVNTLKFRFETELAQIDRLLVDLKKETLKL